MFYRQNIAINLLIRYNVTTTQAGSRANCYALNTPKKRSGKITQFKHYQTDAPV